MHHLVENTGCTARGVTKALLCKAKRIGNSSFVMIFIDLIDLELFQFIFRRMLHLNSHRLYI